MTAFPKFEPIIVKCPRCGFVGDLLGDDFDALGARKDRVFCNKCLEQFYPENHEVKQLELF